MTQKIEPHKITRPIQLLAAWLTGLVLVNTAFLVAAGNISLPIWIAPMLSIAAVANVPIFLIAVFLLQTKYRPQMQDDRHYSEYLRRSAYTNNRISVGKEMSNMRETLSASQSETRKAVETVSMALMQIQSLIEQRSTATTNNDIRIDLTDSKTVDALRDVRLGFGEKQDELFRSHIRIGLNDLIHEHTQIRSRLEKIGFVITDTFGSTNDTPEVPTLKVVSFVNDVDSDIIRILTRELLDFGFTWINLGFRNDWEVGDVYIGSYIYKLAEEGDKYTQIDTTIRAQLNDPKISSEDWVRFVNSKAIQIPIANSDKA